MEEPTSTDLTNVDAIVLGMGPGGEDVAGRLADAGWSVVGIDKALVGGECPYWGCVPSKMMIRAADSLAEARRVPRLAGTSSVQPDWAPVARRIREEATDDWDDTAAVERFEDRGGTFVRGHGRLVATDTVTVGDRTFRARRGVVIATGTRPAVPPIDGLADTPFWTNHEAIEVTDLPASMIVLGGGAIGSELAQVFARFGVSTTIVEAADHLLPNDETEAGAVLAEVFANEGIEVITGATVDRASFDGTFAIRLDDGRELDAERFLVAAGRDVDLRSIGIDAIGIDASAKSLDVDPHLRVTDGVWAVGDVTGKGAFTHVALYQSQIAAADILGEQHEPADYSAVPRVTFTDPEVGAVGMTETQARDAGIDVATGTIDATARSWIHHAGNEVFLKLVADRQRDVLVGATSLGPRGGDVLGLLALAVHAGVPISELRSMIYAYPTFYRGIEGALDDLADVS